MMRSYKCVLCVLAISTFVVTSGCAEPVTTRNDTTSSSSSQDGSSGQDDTSSDLTTADGSPTFQDVTQEVSDAAKATSQFASKEIQDYSDSLNKKLHDLDTRLEQLKQKGKNLAGDAKQQWQEQLRAVEQKRTELQDHVDQLTQASGDAWQDLKAGIDSAWNDLKKATDEAAMNFEESAATAEEQDGETE